MASTALPFFRERSRAGARHWPLIVGFALLAIPTAATLAREVWSRDIGAHGPIVLATGVWLLAAQRSRAHTTPHPSNSLAVAGLLLPSLLLYVFGRAFDFISLETLGLYGVFVAAALRLVGWRMVAANWFPFLYLAFLIPPPGWLIDRITAPLQHFVSWSTTTGLHAAGLPISREGVTLRVAQYQLLVEDACAGMNSIIGLTAITLLYIYLMHRSSWRYAGLLILFILPIAVFVNIIRVTVLVLLTYFQGDAVAQGFLHVTAGMVLFMVALVLVFALDAVLQRLMARRAAAA